jgi:hypothetical protein
MASTKVSYEDWLASGIYPEGSPGKDAGKKFDPADKNLKKYYDNYVVEWDKATEDHRKAINKQHGFTDSEGGGGGVIGGAGGGAGGGVAGAMGYKTPTVSPEVPGSETERVDVKQKFGTPFAESIRGSMIGEVKGLGKRSEDMGAIDRERDFNNAVLAQAQQFASSGMSFSTPMLHAEEDMVRDLARQRLVDADEAATLQKKLDMSRWEAAEPLQRLAAEAKLGDPATGLDFKPGAFGERLLDLDLASVPKGVVKEREESSGGDDKKDDEPSPNEHYTDGKGNVCYYEETSVDEDGVRTCPGTTVGGGETPSPGDHPGLPGFGEGTSPGGDPDPSNQPTMGGISSLLGN